MKYRDEEIKKKLQELTNAKMLHGNARERVKNLEAENRKLKNKVKSLEEENNLLQNKLDDLGFQFEQIKIKLFGKKPISRIVAKKEKKTRDIDSYKRPIPSTVTETRSHPISECAHCHGSLTKKSTKTFYEEDIPLPIQKIVVKHEVEVGYCSSCKRQSSGVSIPSKQVILGDNVKKYACILSIATRMSHQQIQDHLHDIFSLHVSIGEIGKILETEADGLRPEYQSLKDSVVSQKGTHYDETGWKVQEEEQGKYAWVATGTENNDTVFSLGQSRGRGNLDGMKTNSVGISDDYGVYKNAFVHHQLCWAHPHRKLRDLALSEEFKDKKQILKTYEQFKSLYHRIQKSLEEEISPYLRRKWQNLFDEVSESHAQDPTNLTRVKTSLRKNKEKYFTFLSHPCIPIDNNKAERALRHLVIKRKISFGSKTQRGAETTSILASIILSLKWNSPQGWFPKYLALRA